MKMTEYPLHWHLYGYTGLRPYYVKDNADKIIEDLDSICKKLDIKYLFTMGSCLGFIRNGGYIKHDNDIDVRIVSKYDELPKELKKVGFKEGHKFNANQHWWRDEILLDLCWQGHPLEKYIRKFDKITYNGKIYNVPHPVEEYLTDRYKNWKIEKVWNAE